MKKKLIRITTVPISLEKLLDGQLSFMNSFYEVTAISAEKERLIEFGKQHNVNVFPIEMTRKITPIKDLVALINLYKFLRKEKPFIVHTHTPKAGIIGMLASKLANVPNRLHTVAGLPLLEVTGFKRKVLNFVEKLTYKCATKVYPNSIGLKNIIIKNKFTKTNKLKVLANGSSNGIDTSYFNPQLFTNTQNETLKKQLGIAANDFVFIFVGRLVGDKGINELVKAFRELRITNDELGSENYELGIRNYESEITNPQYHTEPFEVFGKLEDEITNSKLQTSNSKLRTKYSTLNTQHSKLLLVGPFEPDLDPLQPETLKEIEENENIISVGWREDVRSYFAVSNVLVFPSYREGFPNVVLQAGAMGLPSIVTDINGCNEIIKQGENGWIIPVKDQKAIENAMEQLLQDKDTYTKAASNARRIIQENFEQQVVWDAILKEYRLLVVKG